MVQDAQSRIGSAVPILLIPEDEVEKTDQRFTQTSSYFSSVPVNPWFRSIDPDAFGVITLGNGVTSGVLSEIQSGVGSGDILLFDSWLAPSGQTPGQQVIQIMQNVYGADWNQL